MPFVTTYHPGVKSLETNTDSRMEFNSKSAIAENHLQLKRPYNIIQERKAIQKTCSLELNSEVVHSRHVAATNPHRGTCAGL